MNTISPEHAIGRVICRMLRNKLSQASEGLKFYFQGINPQCVTEAILLLQKDHTLRAAVEIHLAEKVFVRFGIDSSLLTTHAVGDFRNEELSAGKKIMLLGPPDDSEWDTVRMMKLFGEEQMMEADSDWVDEFAPDHLPDDQKLWWRAALRGLDGLAFARLEEFANFVVRTRHELDSGASLTAALGNSLPALKMPKRSDLFSIKETDRGQASMWRRRLADHKRTTQCFLFKKDKSEVFLDNDVLTAAVKEYAAGATAEPALSKLFQEYADADYGWTSTSEKIAEVEWNTLNAALIEGVTPTRSQKLGAETIALFDSVQQLPDITTAERECLTQLQTTGSNNEPTPEEKAFFRLHYRELQTNLPLFSRWEGYIMEKSVEDSDFLNGLARCMRLLRPRSSGGAAWKIIVRAKSSKHKDLYQLNESAGSYFATRYQALPVILIDSVKFSGSDDLFKFPELLRTWKQDPQVKKKLKVSATSKAACQLVFYVELDSDPHRQIKFVWRFNAKSVSAFLREDVERLAAIAHPAVCTNLTREASGRRSVPLDLSDVSCLQPAFGRTAGTLIPPSDKIKPFAIESKLVEAIATLKSTRQLSHVTAELVIEKFREFEDTYRAALKAFLAKGLGAHAEIVLATDTFSSLLRTASASALSDTALGTILPILLSISTVNVTGAGPQAVLTAIVPPWHPIRLLAITSKARQFADLCRQLTSGKGELSDADGDLFFEDIAERLGHIFYPEIVCQLRSREPVVLSECAHFQEYSTHEPPVKDYKTEAANDNDPKLAAAQIGAVIDSYLDLQPHERDNLSIVLFDCDSELLPEAVVKEIKKLSEDEEQEAMCQILLANSDKAKLRALYRTLSRAAGSSDSYNSSEATRDFMARLRINIMVTENGGPRSREGQPYDIVFAESTIARNAHLAFEPVEIDSRSADSVNPAAWSRRKAIRSGATSSAVYLCSPAAPQPIWDYLNAIAFAKEPEKARAVPSGSCLVPCRTLGVHEESVGKLLDKMHALGAWVVNYDELLHRRLLQHKGIRIIRYKQSATQGKNLIISSTAKDSLLRTELRKLTSSLLPELSAANLTDLVDDLINEANAISGNLVLRAIRRAENAKELLGLVLSKFLVTGVLGSTGHHGWFLLDDYASWLGEDARQIADILCLSPNLDEDGQPFLDIVVTEAKFVEHSSVLPKSKESAAQLQQSLSRLERGLGADCSSLDRPIWLARLSDMIVDGVEAPATSDFKAFDWRKKVRDGGCSIRIRGFSHVFDHGPEKIDQADGEVPIEETKNGVQRIYSFNETQTLLRAFCVKHPPQLKSDDATHDFYKVSAVLTDSTPFAPELERKEAGAVSGDVPAATSPGSEIMAPSATNLEGSLVVPPENPSIQKEPVDDELAQWVKATVVACRKALTSYGMPAQLAGDPILTPNSLLLRFKGSNQLTAAAVEKRWDEFLTTHALAVVSIRPEPGIVAIAIRREKRQTITLAELWDRCKPTLNDVGTSQALIAIRENDNQLLFLAPAPLPHTLVAGGTGSGKSVLLQNIVLSLAATNTPAQTEFVIIDPKRSAQLAPFKKLRHMREPIISEPGPALQALEWLVQEMDLRNERLSEAEASDIDEYISLGNRDMSRIWVVYDEFGDWMSDKEFKEHAMPLLDRLAMKARSSGIYLILAAQRPDKTLFSMVLRSNLGNRLILQVADAGTSDVATGIEGLGAERLLGRGHLLAILSNVGEPVYAQVPFVSTPEVRQLVDQITSRDVGSNGPTQP